MPVHKPAHILLVDDDDAIRDLLSIVLEGSGYRVQTAADGRQAKEALSQQQSAPDLIVLDMMMPVMDGLAFLQWLRQERRATIPVLGLTAMEKAGSQQAILDAGATLVIFKPVNTPHLVTAVNKLLA